MSKKSKITYNTMHWIKIYRQRAKLLKNRRQLTCPETAQKRIICETNYFVIYGTAT